MLSCYSFRKYTAVCILVCFTVACIHIFGDTDFKRKILSTYSDDTDAEIISISPWTEIPTATVQSVVTDAKQNEVSINQPAVVVQKPIDNLANKAAVLAFKKKGKYKIIKLKKNGLSYYRIIRYVPVGSRRTEPFASLSLPGVVEGNLPLTGLANRTPLVSHYLDSLTFSLNWPEKCGLDNGLSLDLLIVVISGVKNFEARMAIRSSWGGHLQDERAEIIFLVAKTSDNDKQLKILEENRNYMDIVQADFVDSYKNLTLKTVAATKWVTEYCGNVKFLYKVDDDVFINEKNLFEYIRENLELNNSIVGYIAKNPSPFRNKEGYGAKWYVPKSIYPYEYYPEYASGCAYLITGDIVSTLYETSLSVPFFDNEDIFMTGMVGNIVGVQRVSNPKMRLYQAEKISKCSLQKIISSAHYTPKELLNAWFELHRIDVKC